MTRADEQVMTGGVDRVARVRAFRTEELTSRDRKVQVFRLHPAVLLGWDDEGGHVGNRAGPRDCLRAGSR